jgi:hypothetical protein
VRLPMAHAAPAVNRKEEAHGLAAAA